jgi:hypothetical protein
MFSSSTTTLAVPPETTIYSTVIDIVTVVQTDVEQSTIFTYDIITSQIVDYTTVTASQYFSMRYAQKADLK